MWGFSKLSVVVQFEQAQCFCAMTVYQIKYRLFLIVFFKYLMNKKMDCW